MRHSKRKIFVVFVVCGDVVNCYGGDVFSSRFFGTKKGSLVGPFPVDVEGPWRQGKRPQYTGNLAYGPPFTKYSQSTALNSLNVQI